MQNQQVTAEVIDQIEQVRTDHDRCTSLGAGQDGFFHRANAADRPLLVSAVNWAEVLYRVEKRQGKAGLEMARQLAAHGPLAVEPVDREQAELAAAYKAAGALALADAFAAALAKQSNAEFVTADHEFKSVEREIKIIWLTNH